MCTRRLAAGPSAGRERSSASQTRVKEAAKSSTAIALAEPRPALASYTPAAPFFTALLAAKRLRMEPVDTLITARWIIPVAPANCVLEDAALVIHQGRIKAVLPAPEAVLQYAPGETIARPHHVVLPGFVNAHTHSAMTLLRGAAESQHLEQWLKQEIWPLERRWIDADYVRDGAALAIAEMLGSGVTCFGDRHLFPEVVAQAAAELHIRASVGLPISNAPTVWAGNVDEYFDKGLRLHDEYRGDPLISTALAPYSFWALSDESLLRLRRNADELDTPVAMRINENAAEAVVNGERTIERLDRLGLLSPLLTAVHAVHVSDEEIMQLSRAGASVVHCPQANLKLGVGVSRAAALLEAGVNVAIGTDGAASNNDLNMLDEVRTAALLARGLHHEAPAVSAQQWLQAATLNGARALGLQDCTGSLTPGKWADVCCIDLRRPQTYPVHDVAAQLVFAASRDQISDVWVGGRQVVGGGSLLHVDVDALLDRAARWCERMKRSS